MSEKSEKAVEYFRQNLCCAQSVLLSFADECGISEETAIGIGNGFSGGMQMASVCGSCVGAVMALGLMKGQKELGDREGFTAGKDFTRQFMDLFEKKHGSIICKDLLQVDIFTPEGKKKANEENLFETLCPIFVQSAVEITEDLLRK